MKPVNHLELKKPRSTQVIIMVLAVVALAAAVFFIKVKPPLQTDAVHVMEETNPHQPQAQLQSTQILTVEDSDQQDKDRRQLQSITAQQVFLREQQTHQQRQFQTQQDQIDQLKQTFSGLTAQLAMQQRQLALMTTARKKKINKRPKKVSKRWLPTFILASIDRWGESQTAVIQDGQHLITLRQGEQHRGWQLTSIDSNQHQVELINARQQQLQLNLR